mgnify:CR=1 FL=1
MRPKSTLLRNRSRQQILLFPPAHALLATDLTGRFPTISSRGYNYTIVCYIYDTNGIIVRPMKNRSTSEHIRVYTDIFDFLQNSGLRPAIYKMDNECQKALRDIIVNVKKT